MGEKVVSSNELVSFVINFRPIFDSFFTYMTMVHSYIKRNPYKQGLFLKPEK